MTISAAERAAAIKRVLVRLSELFWDTGRGSFGDADLAGTAALQTTLPEMEAKGLIELEVFLGDPQPYSLTRLGWFEAQRVAGRLETAEFDERRAQLCATLKRAVKGRHHEALLDCREIAQLANLPEGWVWNVIDGQVLFQLDPHGRYWLRFESGLVYVPVTFGQVDAPLD